MVIVDYYNETLRIYIMFIPSLHRYIIPAFQINATPPSQIIQILAHPVGYHPDRETHIVEQLWLYWTRYSKCCIGLGTPRFCGLS